MTPIAKSAVLLLGIISGVVIFNLSLRHFAAPGERLTMPLSTPSEGASLSNLVNMSSTTSRAASAASSTLPKSGGKSADPADAAAERAYAALNTAVRAATVNILCDTNGSNGAAIISGSGVIVDSRGIVLTNAHVAQYYLLKDYPKPGSVECEVRTGNPAGISGKYQAELLYLPSSWINANAKQITSTNLRGSGEYDFALLRITERTDGSPLPSSFPYLTMTANTPQKMERIFLASYPAGPVSIDAIEHGLYAGSTYGEVANLFVFNSDRTVPEAFSIPSTFVGEEGSSGGPVVSVATGELFGLITAESEGTTSLDRILRAITIAHINTSLTLFGDGGIVQLLSGDIVAKAAYFNENIAPTLAKKLEDALNAAD